MSHILLHTFATVIVILFAVGSSGFTPKRLRTTYSLQKQPHNYDDDNDDDNDESRPCHSCLFFEPHFENGRTVPSLGKCILFGNMETHEYAVHCRSNVFQCGPDAFCYQKKKQTYLQ
jgi:hypothetical protein